MDDASGAVEGTSRRDALKMSGIAALGGVAAVLAGAAAGAEPAGAATTPAHVPTSLSVKLNGVAIPNVSSMEVVSGAYETSSQTDSSGKWVEALTGVQAMRVSLTRPLSSDQSFIDFFLAQNGGQGSTGAGKGLQPGTLSITVRGRHGSTANIFTLSECVPVSWTGPSYDAAVMAKGGKPDKPTESISMS